MRIFLAGASGVIGVRLLRRLIADGHEVAGMTRSPAKTQALRALGAHAVVCDAYDAEALAQAVRDFAADAVIDELTDLPDDPSMIAELTDRTDRMWTEGTRNLVAAAEAAGVQRLFSQSIAWELPGERRKTLRDHERAVLKAGGVVIRYGQLYGPGTYYETDPPPPPRIAIDEAARRTVPALATPAGIVELVEPEPQPRHAPGKEETSHALH